MKKTPSNQPLYFDPNLVKKFAALEQNEKNFTVAAILDIIISQEFDTQSQPWQVAELGGGAHPDRYPWLFTQLLQEPMGKIDWIDISPYMLLEAKQYLNSEKLEARLQVINFINQDIFIYLEHLTNHTLDLAILKYVFNDLSDISTLFKLLSHKLKQGAKLVATIDNVSPQLRSISTNARYLYQGKEFPENESRKLNEGDSYMVQFFNVSGHPELGYMERARVTKYYHSLEEIQRNAEKYRFDFYAGDWKNHVTEIFQQGISLDQDVLVVTKK